MTPGQLSESVTEHIRRLNEEILLRRQIEAYVARVIEAQTLDLSPGSLGKARHRILTETVATLREAAVGNAARAYAGHSRLDSELRRLEDEGR